MTFICNKTAKSKEEWLSYVGDCRQLTDYLARKSFKSAWFPVKFLDALLRGYGQVVFANNPLSGILIAVALMIANPEAALAGLATASVGLLVSMALKQNPRTICSGLTVFNPLLIGLVTVSTLPTKYGLQMDPIIWLFMIFAAVLCVYITSAVSSILHALGPYPAPCFTVPFNITQLILFACIIHKLPYSQMIGGTAGGGGSQANVSSVAHVATTLLLDSPGRHEAFEPVEVSKNVPEKFTEFMDHEAWRSLYENAFDRDNDSLKTSFGVNGKLATTENVSTAQGNDSLETSLYDGTKFARISENIPKFEGNDFSRNSSQESWKLANNSENALAFKVHDSSNTSSGNVRTFNMSSKDTTADDNSIDRLISNRTESYSDQQSNTTAEPKEETRNMSYFVDRHPSVEVTEEYNTTERDKSSNGENFQEFTDHDAARNLYDNASDESNYSFKEDSKVSEKFSAVTSETTTIFQDTVSANADIVEDFVNNFTESNFDRNTNTTETKEEDRTWLYFEERNSSFAVKDNSREEISSSKMQNMQEFVDHGSRINFHENVSDINNNSVSTSSADGKYSVTILPDTSVTRNNVSLAADFVESPTDNNDDIKYNPNSNWTLSDVEIDNFNSTKESQSSKTQYFSSALDKPIENHSDSKQNRTYSYRNTSTDERLQDITHTSTVSPSSHTTTEAQSLEILYTPEEIIRYITQNDNNPPNIVGDDNNNLSSVTSNKTSQNVAYSPSETSTFFHENFTSQNYSNFSTVSELTQEVNSSSIVTEEEGNSYFSTTAYLDEIEDDNEGMDSNGTLERSRRSADVSNSTTDNEHNNTVPTSHNSVDWGQVFAGMVLSSSQVYGFCDAPASATIYLALLVFSPTMAAFSAAGALVGTLTGLLFSNPPYEDVYDGQWGMQGLLCSAVLGGFCYVITVQSAIAAFFCAILSSLLKHVLSGSYEAANLPILSLPFNLATILFLYITSVSEDDFVQPEVLTFPEKHWFDFRKQHAAHTVQDEDVHQNSEKERKDEEKKLSVQRDEEPQLPAQRVSVGEF